MSLHLPHISPTSPLHLHQADPATLKTFPWHKGQHPAADHRASGRPSEQDDIGVWVSTDDPAARAYALDVARRRA